MDFITQIPEYAIPFLLVLSVLVFVHEMGHYLMARACGVRVEIFSIGFGRELFGFNDAHGTRWKFCLIPLGGYVQMFGDADPTSSHESKEKLSQIEDSEKRKAFFFKPVWQRALIVVAGPLINFIYAITVMSALFAVQGQIYAPAKVDGLSENGVAGKAGFKLGDQITAINGHAIESFQELQRAITINLGEEIKFKVLRDGQEQVITASPEVIEQKDNFGFRHQVGRLGIISMGKTAIRKHTPLSAIGAAVEETWSMSAATLKAMGQMIIGTRSPDELGGVIRIGAYAKEFSEKGWLALLMFSALISVNLGLINLFPIPLLDGGHLLFYAYEAIVGKPMSERFRMIGLRIGYVLIIALMIYATLNDLIQLKVFHYFSKFTS